MTSPLKTHSEWAAEKVADWEYINSHESVKINTGGQTIDIPAHIGSQTWPDVSEIKVAEPITQSFTIELPPKVTSQSYPTLGEAIAAKSATRSPTAKAIASKAIPHIDKTTALKAAIQSLTLNTPAVKNAQQLKTSTTGRKEKLGAKQAARNTQEDPKSSKSRQLHTKANNQSRNSNNDPTNVNSTQRKLEKPRNNGFAKTYRGPRTAWDNPVWKEVTPDDLVAEVIRSQPIDATPFKSKGKKVSHGAGWVGPKQSRSKKDQETQRIEVERLVDKHAKEQERKEKEHLAKMEAELDDKTCLSVSSRVWLHQELEIRVCKLFLGMNGTPECDNDWCMLEHDEKLRGRIWDIQIKREEDRRIEIIQSLIPSPPPEDPYSLKLPTAARLDRKVPYDPLRAPYMVIKDETKPLADWGWRWDRIEFEDWVISNVKTIGDKQKFLSAFKRESCEKTILCTMMAQARHQASCRTFHNFSQLPAEIRNKIWSLVFKEETFTLQLRWTWGMFKYNEYYGQRLLPFSAPRLLHVNREVRSMALAHYSNKHTRKPFRAYHTFDKSYTYDNCKFNFATDRLFLNTRTVGELQYITKLMVRDDRYKVKHLVLPLRDFMSSSPEFCNHIALFHGLTNLTLLVGDGQEDQHMTYGGGFQLKLMRDGVRSKLELFWRRRNPDVKRPHVETEVVNAAYARLNGIDGMPLWGIARHFI